jgi:site-specific recombinase XerD
MVVVSRTTVWIAALTIALAGICLAWDDAIAVTDRGVVRAVEADQAHDTRNPRAYAVLSRERYAQSLAHAGGEELDFASVIRRFDAHLTLTGHSERTRHSYRRELVNFWIDWCALRAIDIVVARRSEVEEYLASLPAHGTKRGGAMRAIKAFYAWLEGEHRLDNPAGHLKVPRGKLTPAPELGPEQIRRLMSAAFRKEARRGWAIMLALNTGARVSSLAAIEPRDVELDRRLLRLRVAKGDRPYAVPLNRSALVAARHLVAEAERLERTTLLGVGAARFRQWVHDAEREAGLDRIWPHLLRHAFSNRVAQAGDPEAWRRLMNHADLSQWSRYVRADDERLRRAIE